VRHASAIEGAVGDPSRTLTNKGRKRFRKTARALAKRCPKLDLILTSPFVRAVQTAELLAAEVEHGEVAVLAELAPGASAQALLAAVAKRARGSQTLALVGHQPTLFDLLARLANLSAGQRVEFDNGAIVRIDLSGLAHAKVVRPRWWLDPGSQKRHKGLPLNDGRSQKKEAGQSLAIPPEKAAKKSAALRSGNKKKSRSPTQPSPIATLAKPGRASMGAAKKPEASKVSLKKTKGRQSTGAKVASPPRAQSKSAAAPAPEAKAKQPAAPTSSQSQASPGPVARAPLALRANPQQPPVVRPPTPPAAPLAANAKPAAAPASPATPLPQSSPAPGQPARQTFIGTPRAAPDRPPDAAPLAPPKNVPPKS